jgi:hypothetical protein
LITEDPVPILRRRSSKDLIEDAAWTLVDMGATAL